MTGFFLSDVINLILWLMYSWGLQDVYRLLPSFFFSLNKKKRRKLKRKKKNNNNETNIFNPILYA